VLEKNIKKAKAINIKTVNGSQAGHNIHHHDIVIKSPIFAIIIATQKIYKQMKNLLL